MFPIFRGGPRIAISNCIRKGLRMEPGSQIAPHTCTQRVDEDACGAPAYNGFSTIECTNPKCDHYSKETAAAYRREQIPRGFEDEDTQPQGRATGIKKVLSVKIDGKDIKPVGGFGTPLVIKPITLDFGGDDEETEDELAQQLKDLVDAAKASGASPDECKAMDDWLDDMLRDYVSKAQLAAYLVMRPVELRRLITIRNAVKTAILKTFNDHTHDLHAQTAAKLYGIPENEVTPEQRLAAKRANFGTMTLGYRPRGSLAAIQTAVHAAVRDAVEGARPVGISSPRIHSERNDGKLSISVSIQFDDPQFGPGSSL